MKKDFRFLKSLALTGMLATTILGNVAYADTENKDVKTEPLGIYNKLVTDTEKVVPFILDNREDFVSKKDIQESDEFKNKTVTFDREIQEDTKLHTGDTFKANGIIYTILIYGDVNQDGDVDVFDALTIQENAFESNLKEIQKVAANVVIADKSEMDVFDALAIQQYVGGAIDTILDKIPAKEDEQKPTTPPTPPTPPVETNKIENITLKKEKIETYYRYDNEILIGTVKSATENAKLEEKYIKYKVEKDGVNVSDVSSILKYEEDTTEKGTFKIKFYATEKAEYKIIPCVEGKPGLITRDEPENIINISVKENYEVTDIKIEGEGISIDDNGEVTAEVKEGKTIRPSITLYHKYTDKNGKEIPQDITKDITNNNQEIGNIKVEVSIANKDENNKHITNTTKIYNQDGNPIEKDITTGELTGMDKPISYISIKGESVGDEDTLTIKIGSATQIISVNVLEKAKIAGITVDGTKNIVKEIPINLYTSKPDNATPINEYNNSVGQGKIYKVGEDTFIDIVDEDKDTQKIYTIVPMQLVEAGADGEVVKIIYENLEKGNSQDIEGNVTLVEKDTSFTGKKAGDILPRRYCLTNSVYAPNGTNGQEIDAIGIALNKTDDTTVNRVKLGLEIKYDGVSGREGATIGIAILPSKE